MTDTHIPNLQLRPSLDRNEEWRIAISENLPLSGPSFFLLLTTVAFSMTSPSSYEFSHRNASSISVLLCKPSRVFFRTYISRNCCTQMIDFTLFWVRWLGFMYQIGDNVVILMRLVIDGRTVYFCCCTLHPRLTWHNMRWALLPLAPTFQSNWLTMNTYLKPSFRLLHSELGFGEWINVLSSVMPSYGQKNKKKKLIFVWIFVDGRVQDAAIPVEATVQNCPD